MLEISFALISMHVGKYLFRFSILQHVGYLFVFCMHSSKMQHGETTLRSQKIYFVRSRRSLLLQFRELSNNMEETSNASVPGFVLAPAPNIEGAEESAKYHHEKTTAAKLEIEKTLKVSPQIKDVLRMLIFFANTFVLQIQRTCLKRSSQLARRLTITGGSTKTVTVAMFITLKNLIS